MGIEKFDFRFTFYCHAVTAAHLVWASNTELSSYFLRPRTRQLGSLFLHFSNDTNEILVY